MVTPRCGSVKREKPVVEDNGKSFWRETLQTLIATALVTGVLAAVSFVISKAAAARYKSLHEYGFSIGAGIFFMLSLIIWLAWRRIDNFRPHFGRVHCGYRILEKEITYRYLSRTELRYTKTVRLKALRDMDTFVDKYNWTGQGEIKLSSMVLEHRIIELGTRNIWRMYEVHFGRSLRKNDVIEVAVRWDLKDITHSARPFMSQTVEAPSRSLKFKLEVPEDFGVTKARLTILASIESLSSLKDTDCELRNGMVEWTIKKPRLLHCYQLSWYDPGADSAPPPILQAGISVVESNPIAQYDVGVVQSDATRERGNDRMGQAT
jgi:hypothetical protein